VLPNIATIGIDSSRGSIFRDLTADLDSAGTVQVDYWAAGAPRLRVTSPAPGTHHALFLPRLRAHTKYFYEVRAVSLSGVLGAPSAGTFGTDSLPAALAAVQITAHGTPTAPLTMFEFFTPTYVTIVDQDGEIVWFYGAEAQGATRKTDGHFVFLDPTAGRLIEVSPDGRLVHEVSRGGSLVRMHHDVIATPRNTLYFISQDTMTISDTTWYGDAIWEWDPAAATTTRRWRAFDFFTPQTDRGVRSRVTDWIHANALNLGARGNVLMSFHYLDQIISIAPDFKSIEWRLGGQHATLVPPASGTFSGQHTPSELPGGHVLMFDNGYDRAGGGQWSRALELDISNPASVAVAWFYRPDPDIWARIISSARRLPNGNTVVSFGTPAGLLGSTGPIGVHEVTPDKRVIFTIQVLGPAQSFRATPLGSIAGEVEVTEP
jgi:hypothetical protein